MLSNKGYIGVTGNFADTRTSKWAMKSLVLTIDSVHEQYSGINIMNQLIELADDNHSKVVSVVHDRASSMIPAARSRVVK